MAQSLAQILMHLIFSTKDRNPLIKKDVQPELNSYIAGVLRRHNCPAIIVGSVEDHVHVFFALSKNQSLVKIVEEVKKSSSKWIKNKGPSFKTFQWQSGYGAFSVSQSNVKAVKDYIAKQEGHHQKITFQDELRKFLDKHQIKYDDRYLWD